MEVKSLVNRLSFIFTPSFPIKDVAAKERKLHIILRFSSLTISEMWTKYAWRNLCLCQSIFLFTYIPWLKLLRYRTIHTQTHHPHVHISAVILARFSTVWYGYVAPPSSLFLLSSLSYFGKKQTLTYLLLLSLDNGRLCISCICIHKIKMKAEMFPVWGCYLVLYVLWLLLAVYENGFHQHFLKTNQNQKATTLWT